MTRHRRFLIALGVLQLIAAGVLFLMWIAMNVKGLENRVHVAMEDGLGRLVSAGVVSQPADEGVRRDARGALHDPIFDLAWHAERKAVVPIATLAFFGFLTLLAGVIPDRRRALPPAGG